MPINKLHCLKLERSQIVTQGNKWHYPTPVPKVAFGMVNQQGIQVLFPTACDLRRYQNNYFSCIFKI